MCVYKVSIRDGFTVKLRRLSRDPSWEDPQAVCSRGVLHTFHSPPHPPCLHCTPAVSSMQAYLGSSACLFLPWGFYDSKMRDSGGALTCTHTYSARRLRKSAFAEQLLTSGGRKAGQLDTSLSPPLGGSPEAHPTQLLERSQKHGDAFAHKED